jgi:plasmid stabilization system protein ParE
MKVTIDVEALEEARQQVAWYAERNVNVAASFESLIISTIERIARNLVEFPLLEIPNNAGDVRRARLKGFPLAIVYQITTDEILIAAIAHTSRSPGYWRYRLR